MLRALDIRVDPLSDEPLLQLIPERRLLAAILGRAIVDISGSSVLHKSIIFHAFDWIFGDYPSSIPLTFSWVCEALDLDPLIMREAIKQKVLA